MGQTLNYKQLFVATPISRSFPSGGQKGKVQNALSLKMFWHEIAEQHILRTIFTHGKFSHMTYAENVITSFTSFSFLMLFRRVFVCLSLRLFVSSNDTVPISIWCNVM